MECSWFTDETSCQGVCNHAQIGGRMEMSSSFVCGKDLHWILKGDFQVTYHKAVPAYSKTPVKSLNITFPNKVLPPAQYYSVSARQNYLLKHVST